MKQIIISFRIILAMTVITGIAYPATALVFGNVLFRERAGGSLIVKDGTVIGSELIGQKFSSERYFHGRPSVSAYDGMSSGGSNLGPGNALLIKRIKEEAANVRNENGLKDSAAVPSDLVTMSASGLDPHISIDSAMIQCDRIADARGVSAGEVRKIVYALAERKYFNIAGDLIVNVLELNIAMDERLKVNAGKQ